MRETNFSGEAFVVEWEIFVGREPDWEGFRRWLNNLVDAGNIGRWDVDGFSWVSFGEGAHFAVAEDTLLMREIQDLD